MDICSFLCLRYLQESGPNHTALPCTVKPAAPLLAQENKNKNPYSYDRVQ